MCADAGPSTAADLLQALGNLDLCPQSHWLATEVTDCCSDLVNYPSQFSLCTCCGLHMFLIKRPTSNSVSSSNTRSSWSLLHRLTVSSFKPFIFTNTLTTACCHKPLLLQHGLLEVQVPFKSLIIISYAGLILLSLNSFEIYLFLVYGVLSAFMSMYHTCA